MTARNVMIPHNKYFIRVSWPDVQATQLLPVALPSDAKALARVADAVADYNRALADIKPIPPRQASMTAANSQSQIAASDVQPDHHQASLTPWLAASLAPIGAAVTIQAIWRGRAKRQCLGALAPQLLGRRAAVCIQRAWRMCKPFASLCMALQLGSRFCIQNRCLLSRALCTQHQSNLVCN